MMKHHWWPTDGPFRWSPHHGKPTCVLEEIVQTVWSHRISLYTALVATTTLVLMLLTWFGVTL